MAHLAVTVVLMVLLAGCGSASPSSESTPGADYRAVPDSELRAAVERLPTTRKVELRFVRSSLTFAAHYDARVVVPTSRTRAQMLATLDLVLRILWHGRHQVDFSVSVDGATQVSASDLGSARDLEKRYGKQTGEHGWPIKGLPQTTD